MPTTTIYEKQMWADQQRRMALEQQRLQQQDRANKSFDQSMQQAKFDADETDRDFQRRAKLAELYGKAAAQEGKSGADRMTDPDAQELADVNFRLEKQRVPNMKREADARFGYKMGLEREKDDRLGAQLSVRQQLAQQHEANVSQIAEGKQSIAQRRAEIAQAQLELAQARNPAEIAHLRQQIAASKASMRMDTVKIAGMTMQAWHLLQQGYKGELGANTPESDEAGRHLQGIAEIMPHLEMAHDDDLETWANELDQHVNAVPLDAPGGSQYDLRPSYAR